MRWTNFLYAAALLAVLGLWIGCDSPSSESLDQDLLTREQTIDFDDPYGGFNFGDEAPNFDDDLLINEYGPESVVAYSDAMADDSTVSDITSRQLRRRYLLITWGNLRADTTIDFSTDWSGSLSVGNGVALIKRVIRFEPNDAILPRTSPQRIEWISSTRPHFDGILVALHKSLHRDTTGTDTVVVSNTTDPISVTFATGPLTVTFSEDELADLHRVIRVDDAGNAVAFNTVVVDSKACAAGFLGGQWRNVPDRPGGHFRGRWISHDGVHMGYVRGVYGSNSRGENVFFGKWINGDGHFMGLLSGRWNRVPDHPGGWFEGLWIGRDLRIRGGLRGEWGVRGDVDGGGFFRGVWALRCP
ncbi:MAG: hypothetical protein IH969_08935 [Candidatus Krumholzibacteriota bacterium]|nr:hypothetical protein [Candidatus Krumholzibacteriota bacterium]